MHSAGCTCPVGLHPRVQWSLGALACSLCPSSTCRGSTGMLRQASSLGHRPRRKPRPVFRTPHLHTYGLVKDGLRRAVIPMHGSKYEFVPVEYGQKKFDMVGGTGAKNLVTFWNGKVDQIS